MRKTYKHPKGGYSYEELNDMDIDNLVKTYNNLVRRVRRRVKSGNYPHTPLIKIKIPKVKTYTKNTAPKNLVQRTFRLQNENILRYDKKSVDFVRRNIKNEAGQILFGVYGLGFTEDSPEYKHLKKIYDNLTDYQLNRLAKVFNEYHKMAESEFSVYIWDKTVGFFDNSELGMPKNFTELINSIRYQVAEARGNKADREFISRMNNRNSEWSTL